MVGFDRTEYLAIDKLHKRVCDVTPAHDAPSAKKAAVPTAAELGRDISTLQDIVKQVKERRKAASAKSEPSNT